MVHKQKISNRNGVICFFFSVESFHLFNFRNNFAELRPMRNTTGSDSWNK